MSGYSTRRVVRIHMAKRKDKFDNPGDAEDRPATASPGPTPAEFAAQVAEMYANDEELAEWRRSERLADLFGGSPR